MWTYNYGNKYELYHHGIKGQQWGVRNGPPYPLNVSIKKKSNSGNTKSSEKDTNNAPKQGWSTKKKIVVGAVVATAALIVIGGMYVKKNIIFPRISNNMILVKS